MPAGVLLRLSLLLAACVVVACGTQDATWSPPRIEIWIVEPSGTSALGWNASLPPDHAEDGKRAWRLATIFGPALDESGALVEVQTAGGEVVRIADPAAREDDRTWVLTTNRRGETLLLAVLPSDPFPAFHGRGGGRGRTTEEGERIRDVTRLTLRLGPRAEATPDEPLRLIVDIDGEKQELLREDLLRLPARTAPGDSGQGEWQAWSLHDLARALGGPDARVASVSGEGGREVEIDEVTWADPARVPLLRLNRRGQLKFAFANAGLQPIEGETLRTVRAIRIVR